MLTLVSSGTSSATVKSGITLVHGIQVLGAASAGSVALKDGGSSGTVRFQINTGASAIGTQLLMFPTPIKFLTDCYVAISNATVNVIYE